MNEWTSGYVADIDYTYGYYSELNPLRLQLAFANVGVKAPEVAVACELGFCQGLSANIHAAASDVKWFGTDFNPSQAGFARELANVAGADAQLFDESFAEFCNRSDIPDFDYIGLHGIWSWVSDENRSVIVDFIRRKLKVGGVLFISYNTLPGMGVFAPMRHLMARYADSFGVRGKGIVSRIDGAIGFAEKLLDVNPKYLLANPQLRDRMNQLKTNNRNYLAHEYFNRDWHPVHFLEMADWLAPAKMSFVCSPNTMDHIDAANLTGEQKLLLDEIPDPLFREAVRDFMINQQFRKDYWVKGARSLVGVDRIDVLRKLRVTLLQERDSTSLKATGALGEVSINETLFAAILDKLGNLSPKSIGQLEIALKNQNISLAQILESILVLTGSGQMALAHEDASISKASKSSEKLNAHLLNRARIGNDILFLASPVIGGGVRVGRFQQLFLLALKQGKKRPSEWAQFAWEVVSSQGQRLVRDNQALLTDADNISELTKQANEFGQKQLPVLKSLSVC